MMKYSMPSHAHNWVLTSVIEPDFDRKIDGQKIYICSICMKTKICLIP